MDENQPTTRQLVIFTVVLSFIASMIGTVLTLGVMGPILGLGEESGGPLQFNKPGILERIKETVTQKETSEKVLRQDELVVKVVEEASQAVVSIVAAKDVPVIEQFFIDPFSDDPLFREFFGDGGSGFRVPQLRERGTQKTEVSSGTGFIVSSDGMVITNRHVVSDTKAEFTALLNDGRKLAAKVLASDPLHDIAILKIEGNNFPALRLGNSDKIKIGQTAIAIGNALGEFRNTVSVGVVSGLGRTIMASGSGAGTETLRELIQTDAAINPGNSGGPLLNLYGEVIGMNTAIASGAENIGFAIPINKAKRDLENVKVHGKIIYPFLGVRYTMITKELAEKEKLSRDYGALVVGAEGEASVLPGSPAEKAGVKERDIILEINGEILNLDNTLATVIQKHQVGEEVSMKVFREGKEMELKAVLEERK